MKRRSKPDAALVGNVANNPRYDKVYSVRNGMDAKALKDGEDNTLYGSMQSNFRKRLREIYGGRYGVRQTASGRYREVDEPSDEIQLKQADAINKLMQQRKAASGRERLKTKGAVPVRAASGKKLFEDFVKTARQHQKQQQQKQDLDNADMRNIYNSANSLSYEKWIWFVNDEYSSRI
jgi:hypothetical protein